MIGGWWFQRNYPKASEKITKWMFIYIVVPIFIGSAYFTFVAPVIEGRKFTTIKGSLLSKPTKGHYKDSNCISLKVKEYPEKIFHFKSSTCEILNTEEFIKDVKIGDTILLEVSKKAISINDENISFQSLSYDNKDYFTSKTESFEKESHNFFWTFILILAFIILIIYLVLDLTGVLDKMKAKYFTDSKKELTTIEDFTEFPE